MSRVIRLVECDGCLRPLQIICLCWGNHVNLSVNHFQSTSAFHICEDHQSGVDMRISSLTVLFVFGLVRLLLLVLRLFSLKLLDQESTLASGVLWVNDIPLFIFLCVNVTRHIHHVVPFFILYLLGVPGSFWFPLKLSLSHGQSLSRSCRFSLPLLFPTGVSFFRLTRLVLAASESVFFFAVGVLGSNLHHPTQGHVTGSTKFQTQFSVLDAVFEGAYCLMVRDIFHSVVQSDPPLNILSESLIGFLHADLQLCQSRWSLASPFERSDEHSGQIFPSVNAARR